MYPALLDVMFGPFIRFIENNPTYLLIGLLIAGAVVAAVILIVHFSRKR